MRCGRTDLCCSVKSEDWLPLLWGRANDMARDFAIPTHHPFGSAAATFSAAILLRRVSLITSYLLLPGL